MEGLRGEVQGGPFFPQDERLAVAFKSTTVTPRTIVELAKRLQFMKKIEVVRGSELKAGYSTPGIVRENAFESIHRYIIVSRTRVTGGAVSDWHHHGARHLYGFLEAGRMRLECGLKGVSDVEVGRGDFFHIPPRLVHRDVNPNRKQELVVVNILVGRGDSVINVKSPKRA